MGKTITVMTFGVWVAMTAMGVKAGEDVIKEGKRLTLEYCQACHHYQGTEQAGTVAPPLLGMKARFPDRKKLYNIIYDPQVAIKKDTMMPPS